MGATRSRLRGAYVARPEGAYYLMSCSCLRNFGTLLNNCNKNDGFSKNAKNKFSVLI